jgi:hypothetical protein
MFAAVDKDKSGLLDAVPTPGQIYVSSDSINLPLFLDLCMTDVFPGAGRGQSAGCKFSCVICLGWIISRPFLRVCCRSQGGLGNSRSPLAEQHRKKQKQAKRAAVGTQAIRRCL